MDFDSSRVKLATSQFRSPLLLGTTDADTDATLGSPAQSAVLSRATSAGKSHVYSLALDYWSS